MGQSAPVPVSGQADEAGVDRVLQGGAGRFAPGRPKMAVDAGVALNRRGHGRARNADR